MYDLSALCEVRKTERLLLRPFLKEDAGAFYACLSSPDVLKYEDRAPLDEENSMRELSARMEDTGSVAICLPPTEAFPWGRLIGFISVYEIDGCVFWGYLLSADEQKKGYAREACRAVLDVLISLDIPSVFALSDVENAPSNALLSDLGFTLFRVCENGAGREVGLYLYKKETAE